MVLFDIFPKDEKTYLTWAHNCAEGNGILCQQCPYCKTVRDCTCFDICLKGDWDLWMHFYDMSKPLLRRYIGKYEWERA